MNKYNKQISFAKHLIFVYGWGDITFPLFHDNGSPWWGRITSLLFEWR
jgi:hypothetical protein